MNTFDRHLLREWLQILGLVLAATCGLLLLQVLYDDFRSLREHGARGWELWKYVGVRIPSFLATVLPMALLVSLLFTLGKLHRSNELTAMRAAGVGFMRLTASIWIIGVFCCALSWGLNTTIVPWSVETSRALEDEMEFRHQSRSLPEDRTGAVSPLAFDNQRDGRMWFFNRYSRYTQMGYGVSVSQLDAGRRETTRIVASQAGYDPQRRGWFFENGRELTFDTEKGVVESSTPFKKKFVDRFGEDPQLMLLLGRRASSMSIYQLRDVIAYYESQKNPQSAVNYAVRYYGLIASTLGPLIVIAIAIPFAVSGVRVNPAVGVSKSIGLFFLYYVLNNAATSLASRQILEPQIAAWLPSASIAALALWLFARLR
ncbi:MAG TPA: LptF/LptG family permease [Opitutaceae bacterium]|nr:LptF/LptG family permease [Opitutaceae bacterium]